jgi:serine/threonine-protein kinase
MGDVYRATDTVLGRTVAIKVLAERHAREPEIRERFTREARAAASLSGIRHVVTVFDVGEHRGRPFIVMECLEGGTLHDRLRESRVDPERALDWLDQAGQGLDQAHARGVVHRDVKPANLLLDADESVYVSDFGIASAGGFDTLTLPGTVLGTAGYLSPEQASGEPATAASDRYALGVVAFELLTGRRPFASETAATEAFAHAHAPVPSATQHDPSLPGAVDAVFRDALAKDPGERPRAAADLVGRLRQALAEGPAPTTIHAPDAPRKTIHRTRRPRRAAAVLAAAALLAAGIALAAALGIARNAGGSGTEPPATTEATAGLAEGKRLNDVGFARMQAGRFEGALAPLVRAVDLLRGTGTRAEAYARYNLAYTRLALGHCTGVLTPLERSEAIQGPRAEIEELRAEWRARCAPPPPAENGKGNGKGKGRKHDKDDER